MRRTLVKQRPGFALADKQTCVAETTMGGVGELDEPLWVSQISDDRTQAKCVTSRFSNYLIER